MGTSTLGERLRAARDLADLKQKAAANKVHVSAQALSKNELDKSVPSCITALALADLYNVRYRWLITGQLPMRSACRPELAQLRALLEHMSADARAEVIAFARAKSVTSPASIPPSD